jgi:hypothetical protein
MISSGFTEPACRKIEVTLDGMMGYNVKLMPTGLGANED